jgi:hypothetical protein
MCMVSQAEGGLNVLESKPIPYIFRSSGLLVLMLPILYQDLKYEKSYLIKGSYWWDRVSTY